MPNVLYIAYIVNFAGFRLEEAARLSSPLILLCPRWKGRCYQKGTCCGSVDYLTSQSPSIS